MKADDDDDAAAAAGDDYGYDGYDGDGDDDGGIHVYASLCNAIVS